MVDGPSDTIYITVPTASLDAAITELNNRDGKALYPAAWRVLTTESDRRRDAQGVAAAFGIARDKFEELPPKVKELLS
jgi:hypothetical protein